MDEQIQKLQKLTDAAHKIVFFGGAGVSTESGIPDFRSKDGLYNQKYAYPPETIISRSFFDSNPEEFYRFYREKMLYPDAQPNAAHLRLAELERAGRLLAVVTQNIDGLHQKAGSQNVFELHGSVKRNYCMKCHNFFNGEYVRACEGVPYCDSCGGVVKPDVVLYEEPLDTTVMEGAISAISAADMLIVGGTSLSVYPAAGLLRYFRGSHLVLINRSVTAADASANLVIRDKIGEVFAQLEV